MPIDLFDGSDSSTDEAELTTIKVDENYARRLEHNKRREALQRLQELKKRGLDDGSDGSEESSGDDDDEDEEPDKSGKNDLKFFETLVRVKKKDPAILSDNVKVYSSDEEDDDEDEKPRAAKKERPLYLKDVNARHLIEEGPEFEEKPLKYDSKVYNKEQAEGVKAFLEAEKAAFAYVDDEDDILKVKEKAGEAEKDENTQKMDQNLDEYFGKDDDLSDNEKFLKEYLRNRMWIGEEKDKKPSFDDLFGVSEDEDELDKQDKFEADYNFRFEEGGADRVLGHSRVIEGSVRKKTSSRKLQRKSKEERMAQAEFERKEELKHLKNLKKKEIQEKLEKIRAIAGIGDDGTVKLDEDDLEEDFDPEEYDKKMKEMFGDVYYDAEDVDPGFGIQEDEGLEKPDFDMEDEFLGLPNGWDTSGTEGFEATRKRILKQREEEEPEKEDGKRKRKRKISLKEKVELDKELEDYYKLDYEDTIGDLKTRFKYKSVPANRFGMRPEEILTANDKDLNQYVSLKKLAPYREKEWKVTYHQKLKKDLILYGEKSDQKSSKKSKPKGISVSTEPEKQVPEMEEPNDEEVNNSSRRSRRRRRQAELKLSRSRLMAYGKIPSKSQKKH